MARGKARGRYSPSRDGGGSDDSGRWLTTYSDAITLLMAFFVMLYAISQIDHRKFEAFVAGLSVFGNTAGDSQEVLDGGTSLLEDTSPQPAEAAADETPDLAVLQQPLTTPPTPSPTPTEEEDEPAREEDLDAVRAAIIAALEVAGLPHVAEFRRDERGLVVSIATEGVLFDTGSTAISPRGERIVAAIARALARFPNDVLVEGHTDNVPLRRAGYTNWNLSTDRAVAVLQLLASGHGISPLRLGAVGYGEFRPLVPNSGPANRARNRRVDILVVANQEHPDG